MALNLFVEEGGVIFLQAFLSSYNQEFIFFIFVIYLRQMSLLSQIQISIC